MILKALTLENFKGVREPVRVEFAPLTLLFGPNNAGKSTIVQALMYAREVLEGSNCDASRTALGGDVVDLGGFRSLVHEQDCDRAIRMRFELDLSPNGLPCFMSEAEKEDLRRREYGLESLEDRSLEEALGVRNRFSWARGQFTDLWVEIEIGHRKSRCFEASLHPVVRRYSIGSGRDIYATILLPEDSERATLSCFNFGVPPFGCSYAKGDSCDYDWDLSRLVRNFAQWLLSNWDIRSRGLKKGAHVAFAGEPIVSGSNTLSRDDFDGLVSEIVRGEGVWGDDSIDPETGKPHRAYQYRQECIERAHAIGRLRAAAVQKQLQKDSGAAGSPQRKLSPKEYVLSPEDLELSPDETLLYSTQGIPTLERNERDSNNQWMGWFLEWVTQLIVEPHDCIELTTRGTALPNWSEGIQPYTDIWWDGETKDINDEWLSLGREKLIEFWNVVIVGPGKLLLGALRDSTYLGPLRKLPSRHYRPGNGPDKDSWANGLAAWNLLMTESTPSLIEEVNAWLLPPERFGTGYRIEIQRRKQLDVRSSLWNQLMTGSLLEHQDTIRKELTRLPEETVKLEFVNASTGLALAPQDLGVGVSQVLPVIVAALYGTHGVVAVEEPESNVHPAFQVVLADLFLTQANARPEVLFLVETHSEHLLLRCLRRIRETTKGLSQTGGAPRVTPEELAVHFVEPCADGPRIHRIEIDGEGDFLDPWPQGFFRERVKELYGDDL
jgi:hypothetical protein